MREKSSRIQKLVREKVNIDTATKNIGHDTKTKTYKRNALVSSALLNNRIEPFIKIERADDVNHSKLSSPTSIKLEITNKTTKENIKVWEIFRKPATFGVKIKKEPLDVIPEKVICSIELTNLSNTNSTETKQIVESNFTSQTKETVSSWTCLKKKLKSLKK